MRTLGAEREHHARARGGDAPTTRSRSVRGSRERLDRARRDGTEKLRRLRQPDRDARVDQSRRVIGAGRGVRGAGLIKLLVALGCVLTALVMSASAAADSLV